MCSATLELESDLQLLASATGCDGAQAKSQRHRKTTALKSRVECESRARRIFDTYIEYIQNDLFENPDSATEILGPLPREEAEKVHQARRKVTPPPKGTPPYLASLYEVPLLTPAQEAHLFRKMNYLKYRARVLRDELDTRTLPDACLEAIETHLERAVEIRNRIVQANLRLVVSIAKRFVDANNSFADLVSDGNVPLIRAVEIFDYSRGFRFSTYATWAVRNSFLRLTPRARRQAARFISGAQDLFEGHCDFGTSQREYESRERAARDTTQRLLKVLDDRERWILITRFGLDGSGQQRKFREISADLSISTERVRQLVARSLVKLREFAVEEGLEAPEWL